MTATTILLDPMGGVALLLWGLHMVRSGISRAFGSSASPPIANASTPSELCGEAAQTAPPLDASAIDYRRNAPNRPKLV